MMRELSVNFRIALTELVVEVLVVLTAQVRGLRCLPDYLCKRLNYGVTDSNV